MCKSDDGSATRRDQSAVKFTAGAEAAEEEVDRSNEHGGVKGCVQTRSQVGDTGDTEPQHRLPIIQHRFFEPRLALRRRSHPIGVVDHFARYFRVSGLVGAEQAKGAEAMEEKESAERHQ